MTKYLLLLIVLFNVNAYCQDPHFSQFFAAPFVISPASTGNTNADMKAMVNLRQQWINPASAYYSGSFSFEKKLFSESLGDNMMGVGIGFLHDNTFDGILKSSYFSLNIAYHQVLDADVTHFLSMGIGAIYGKRDLDFSRLVFASQFASGGFNTSLPTGEKALSDMQGYLALNAGLTYTFSDPVKRFDIGVSGYNLNSPRQTFLQDPNQIVPRRICISSSYDKSFEGSGNSLNVSGFYQTQSNLNYLIVGGAYSINLSGSEYLNKYFSFGAFYRHQDAIIPYVGFTIDELQFGLSYDATTSKLTAGAALPKTIELTFSWRRDKQTGQGIKCPSFRPF